MQKKACLDIITSKDSLIREFKKQLKLKDEEAVKSLKRYGEDVEELLKRMRREIRELQQHYEVRRKGRHKRGRGREEARGGGGASMAERTSGHVLMTLPFFDMLVI